MNYYRLYFIGLLLFITSLLAGKAAGGLLVLLFIAGLSALFRLRYEFILTEDRIISRVGLIARNTNEMKLRHIRSILLRQNLLERLLGIGTLIMISAADEISQVPFSGINNPLAVKETINRVSN